MVDKVIADRIGEFAIAWAAFKQSRAAESKTTKDLEVYFENGRAMFPKLRQLSECVHDCSDEELEQLIFSQEFNGLDEEVRAMLIGANSNLMLKLLQKDMLKNYSAENMAMMITGYVIDVSPLLDGGGIFVDRSKYLHSAAKQQREEVCWEFVQRPGLLNKINPAARILLLAFLKQSDLFAEKQREPAFSRPLLNRVAQAYKIRTDYNPDKQRWDKYLWPAMAGDFGIGDYIGRFNELYLGVTEGVCYGNETPFETPDERLAVADVLLADSRFAEYMRRPVSSEICDTRYSVVAQAKAELYLERAQFEQIVSRAEKAERDVKLEGNQYSPGMF